MKDELFNALSSCETDIDGALQRFAGDESLYLSLLQAFLNEPTMANLENAIEEKNWNNAFMAAHALKGLAANMGFVPLFHAIGELIVKIRTGKTKEIDVTYQQIQHFYDNVIEAIKNNI